MMDRLDSTGSLSKSLLKLLCPPVTSTRVGLFSERGSRAKGTGKAYGVLRLTLLRKPGVDMLQPCSLRAESKLRGSPLYPPVPTQPGRWTELSRPSLSG